MQELLLICAGAFSIIVYAAQGVHYVVPKTASGRAGGGPVCLDVANGSGRNCHHLKAFLT
jgi:hypothetical protein